MNLLNATLTRIDTAGTPSAAGVVGHTTGSAISVRVTLTEPGFRHQQDLSVKKIDADAVLYVLMNRLGAITPPAMGDKVVVALDLLPAATYLIQGKKVLVKAGGLSHYEYFVKTL